jgi:hypothetical protein
MNLNRHKNEHTFSIELNSKSHVGLELPKGLDDSVLVEGTLGRFISLRFVERAMLEIRGSTGILRIDLNEKNWTGALENKSKNEQNKPLEGGE